jgi:3',5'-cyclic AMP phosphodiesterase CpdA
MEVAAQTLIAQLSDLHLCGPGRLFAGHVDTAAMAAKAVEHVNGLDPEPDLVLITGDLVESGKPEQYDQLKALLKALRPPVRLIPGNHDDREMARELLYPERQPGDRVCDVVEIGAPGTGTGAGKGLRLVLLDDVIPGSPCGELGEEQLAWLDRALATEPHRPTVIAVHHPPFETGILHMDAMGLLDADAFETVVRRHAQVEAVLCGHLHRPIAKRWAGTIALTAPSVAHQVTLDLGPESPMTFKLEPPAILLHRWSEAAGLVSHLSYVASHEAFPFPRAGE